METIAIFSHLKCGREPIYDDDATHYYKYAVLMLIKLLYFRKQSGSNIVRNKGVDKCK